MAGIGRDDNFLQSGAMLPSKIVYNVSMMARVRGSEAPQKKNLQQNIVTANVVGRTEAGGILRISLGVQCGTSSAAIDMLWHVFDLVFCYSEIVRWEPYDWRSATEGLVLEGIQQQGIVFVFRESPGRGDATATVVFVDHVTSHVSALAFFLRLTQRPCFTQQWRTSVLDRVGVVSLIEGKKVDQRVKLDI